MRDAGLGDGPKADEGWLVIGEVVSTFSWAVLDVTEVTEDGLVR